jgi:carbonic anhydrase
MKRIIQGLVLAALVSAVQTSQASAFPASGDETSVPVAWTYADRHAGEMNQSIGSAFPASGDEKSVPVAWTYADKHAGELQIMGNAFPASGDEKPVPVASTYADRFADKADQRTAALSD